jgi:hypothetical protein
MYHPQKTETGKYSADDFEFIELKNINSQNTINLSMIHFSDGIEYTFPGYDLLPGEYVVLVKDREAFFSKYPDTDPADVLGPFKGNLNNGGETLTLSDGNDIVILSLTYKDKWFDITDGKGFSITMTAPENTGIGELSDKENWQASSVPGGTPSKKDSGTPFTPEAVIINEMLAHSHDNAPDWIELYNTEDFPINIGGWYISDEEKPDVKKYRIAEGTLIPPKGYIVFTEDDNFRNEDDPGCLIPFSLNDDGEIIFVVPSVNNEIIDEFINEEIGASETGVSWGIHIKSTGKTDFVPLDMNTPGAANSEPRIGPIVINEIMYNPAGDGDAEYIELLNIGNEPVILFDEETGLFWKLTDQGGLDFNISDSERPVTINPGECILLVKNRYIFNLEYKTARNTIIYEWGANGKLSNSGEKIRILKPGEIDRNIPYYILADIVNYNDKNLWPVSADGEGFSLHRINPEKYGNDPQNWEALNPTPGVK